MKKHYISVPRNYSKFDNSLSDSEVVVRRSSCEHLDELFTEEFKLKCSVGNGLTWLPSRSRKSLLSSQSKPSTTPPKLSPTRASIPLSSKGRTAKAFTQMKIKDEVKMDLREDKSSDRLSFRSACKIYPIDEVSENASRASSKMQTELLRKRQEVQRIVEENKSRAKCRPGNNANKYSSMMQLHEEVEIGKPPFHRSSHSAIEDDGERISSRSPPKSEDRFNSFGSLSSFKQYQIQRLSNDCLAYQDEKKRHMQKFDDSYNERLTIRSYSSRDVRQPTSCFGCFMKPLVKMCTRNSRKF